MQSRSHREGWAVDLLLASGFLPRFMVLELLVDWTSRCHLSWLRFCNQGEKGMMMKVVGSSLPSTSEGRTIHLLQAFEVSDGG